MQPMAASRMSRFIDRIVVTPMTKAGAVPRRSGLLREEAAVLDTAYCETQSIGVHVAMTCTALVVGAGKTMVEPARFLPPMPVVLGLAATTMSDLRVLPESPARITRFATQLTHARELVMHQATQVTGREPGHADIAVQAWMMMAEDCLHVLQDFHALGQMTGLAIDMAADEPLSAALRACRVGGAPCLVDGAVTMPSWAQRRRARRIPLHMGAWLRSKGQLLPVRVTNVSRGGFGIAHAQALEVGAIAALTLETGRRFVCSVAWKRDGEAGLALAKDLPANDPLISGG